MRWIILLAALGGVFWAVNWINNFFENAILITDYWKAQGSIKWGIVHFDPLQENPEVYAINSVRGYWGILKGLWPVWFLFSLVLLVLIPVMLFISNSLTKLQITNANEAQQLAEERAKNAAIEAKKREIEISHWADEKVKNAEDKARSKVNTEFIKHISQMKCDQDEMQKREEAISAREQAAREAEIAAQQKVDEILTQYEKELALFNDKIRAMESTKNNAQQAFKRIRQKTLKGS
jgi:uncharacterized membrane protein